MAFIDMTGKHFGRLQVLARAPQPGGSRSAHWVCLCDCGTNKIVLGASLRQGLTKSCGCYNGEHNKPVDHAGKKYGRWTVIRFIEVRKESAVWLCRCDCGTEKELLVRTIVSGASKSCGCHRDAMAKLTHTRHGNARKGARSRVHRVWTGMKQRCHNPNFKQFKDYGGRGITVCDRWRDSFENFYADMGDPPTGYSIERKNNDGNYEPDNCKWATAEEQGTNKRPQSKEVYLTHDGETLNLSQWSRRTGINRITIMWRIRNGRSVAEALTAGRRP